MPGDAPESQLPRYPVRVVAGRTGLSPHVLRAWERRYQVVAPTRSEGGQRLYSDLDIARLRTLRLLTDDGHAISRLAGMTLDELKALEQIPVEPGAPTAGADASVGEAVRAAMRFDSAELQAVLERAAVTYGVPTFLDQMVAPALERIGHGWAEGSVSIAQEHMATVVFRRVLGWLLGVYQVEGPAPRLVVATPAGETHELGALLAAVSAAAEGWRVTYLGPDVPLADLVSAAEETRADAVALSIVYPSGNNTLLLELRRNGGLSSNVPLIVGGAGTRHFRTEAESAGALVVGSLPEFRSLLGRLADRESE